jgi:Zn ribbon nucleic-acid-binding protein
MKGVDATVAKGKRVEIVKVQITGPDGATIDVDGKACTKCGVERQLGDFSSGSGALGRRAECSLCRNRSGRKQTNWCTNTYISHVESVTSLEYRVVGEYIGAKQKVVHRHESCGHEWGIRPNDFLRGRRCPKCAGNLKKSQVSFLKEVCMAVGEEYIVQGTYAGAHLKIEFNHLTCGDSFKMSPNSFLLQGHRCPKCSYLDMGKRKTKLTRDFKEEVIKLVGGDYSVISAYVSSKSKLEMRHNKCGLSYLVTPSNFIKGTRCPFCAESRGERRVREYLTANSYDFTPQHTFDDCRDVDPLRFDFAVHFRDYDVLIEYDGIQHSEPVDFAGKGELWALEQFRNTQRRDRIKTDYCRANGIDLIRIRYDQFDDIGAILDRRLSALGITGNCPAGEAA